MTLFSRRNTFKFKPKVSDPEIQKNLIEPWLLHVQVSLEVPEQVVKNDKLDDIAHLILKGVIDLAESVATHCNNMPINFRIKSKEDDNDG